MLKKLIRKFFYGHKADSASYVKYLRVIGMKVGNNVNIYAPTKCLIDETRPWLIEIGDNVEITEGVTILTRGYDWAVLKGVYGEVLGSSGGVKINNNVFIGVHSTILKGVTIGNNVIIGANSLVNKDIPDNVVAAGNPCKVIMSLEDYYKKRKAVQLAEATELVKKYRERYGREPDEKALHEFFWLFTSGDDELCDIWKRMMTSHQGYMDSYKVLESNNKLFDSMCDFLNSIK